MVFFYSYKNNPKNNDKMKKYIQVASPKFGKEEIKL